jgi:SAM-dependent methyltransferase
VRANPESAQAVGRASRLPGGRLALGLGDAGETSRAAGETPAPLPERPNPYETKRYLREYLLLHYGRPGELCPFPFVPRELLRFHERLREEYLLPVRSRARSRGLDLGCAVGRFTFELGRVVDHALGLDNSKSFIQAARRMARQHSLAARVQESGAQFSSRPLALPKALRRCRVEFQVGDALDLAAFPNQAIQVVSAINLIDRLPHPRRFLLQLPRLLAPGGQLLIASPFTWLEEHTPVEEWLSSAQVRSLLRPFFRLARHGDVPFVIREHRRKYQLGVAEVFTFVRRSGAGVSPAIGASRPRTHPRGRDA